VDAYGLSLTVAAIDDGFPAVEIRAWNHRFAATTLVWVPIETIAAFADCISGFPAKNPDERIFDFGHRRGEMADVGVRWVPGFCHMEFRYGDGVVRSSVDVYVEDDESDTDVRFVVPVEAAALDRFVLGLRRLANPHGSLSVGASAVLSSY